MNGTDDCEGTVNTPVLFYIFVQPLSISHHATFLAPAVVNTQSAAGIHGEWSVLVPVTALTAPLLVIE